MKWHSLIAQHFNWHLRFSDCVLYCKNIF